MAGVARTEQAMSQHTNYSRKNTLANERALDEYIMRVKKFGFRNGKAPIFSWSQMGTAHMGPTANSSVVDPQGETWEVRDLWVVDSSVLPAPTGIEPAVTVAATAHYIAQFIKARLL